MVPTFKQTSDPIDEVFQMQDDNIIETDYSCLHSEPLDVYSRQVLHDDEFQDTVYGTDKEFNTLFYDIDHNLDNEASEKQKYQSSIYLQVSYFYLRVHPAKYTISVSC